MRSISSMTWSSSTIRILRFLATCFNIGSICLLVKGHIWSQHAQKLLRLEKHVGTGLLHKFVRRHTLIARAFTPTVGPENLAFHPIVARDEGDMTGRAEPDRIAGVDARHDFVEVPFL